MNNKTAQHLMRLAIELSKADTGNPQAWEHAGTILQLHTLGKALHRRYEAACSYEWATTPSYEKRTEALEAKLLKIAKDAGFGEIEAHKLDVEAPWMQGKLYIALQRDPRGWPIILSIGGRVDRVGGDF